jgi:penicillin-binding protein 2
MGFLRRKKQCSDEIFPDEIFLDSSNIPEFDEFQFEGRLEKPIKQSVLWSLGLSFLLIVLVFSWKAATLQIVQGEYYAEESEQNRLHHTLIFSERGSILDRVGEPLAWNFHDEVHKEFLGRKYKDEGGFGHVVGYVKYPAQDSSGFYYETKYQGIAGIERVYNDRLAGENGLKIAETDALGGIRSESVVNRPVSGEDIHLTIDSRVQEKLYSSIESLAKEEDFGGGAGIIMDVNTGELLAITSFPEVDPNILTEGESITSFLDDTRNPFLNRAISGLYAPGSIMKLFIAMGILDQDIIDPYKKILSTGEISVPNPFIPDEETIFKDWKAHGWVDLRDALAVSSNVYFYATGGGYEDQAGIGISQIERYVKLFGFAAPTGVTFADEATGVVPGPEWKKENFEDGVWRTGDTYHTAIGQYGFQITPIQSVRATASLSNGGVLHTPVLIKGEVKDESRITLEPADFKVVQEGMRQAVLSGSAQGLNIPWIEVAAKTGTAEIGTTKSLINSWVTGFFPYKNPRFAFTVLMEKGPRSNSIGATFVMWEMLNWMQKNTPEYLQ